MATERAFSHIGHTPRAGAGKKGLVLLGIMDNVTHTMKRTFTLIVLVGLVAGAVLTGCNQGGNEPAKPDTNAAPAAPAPPPAPAPATK